MRESYIQKKVGEYAERRGWKVYPWSSPSQRGVPDRIYIKAGAVIFVEFKAEGKKPSALQGEIHKELRAQACTVHVVDNIEQGKALVDAGMRDGGLR